MPPPQRTLQEIVRMRVILLAASFFMLIQMAVTTYASPLYGKQDYHTSALTGHAWVMELLNGHPDRIRTELGMRKEVFLLLIQQLQIVTGLSDSRYVSIKEQVAIFLYMSGDAALLGHVTMHPPPPPPILISIHANIRPLPPSPGHLPQIPASGLAKPDSLHQGVLLPLVPDALALIRTTPLPSRALVLASDVSTGRPGTGLATGLLQCGLPLLVSQELAITGPSEPLTILSGIPLCAQTHVRLLCAVCSLPSGWQELPLQQNGSTPLDSTQLSVRTVAVYGALLLRTGVASKLAGG
ncbi:unnamed protein product [Mycena citricolor]|uniref:DUF8040 domain-containing protein n=1 Tax=Mycena citricolor TaxID=2018698 RepID=A0AAD2JXB7_9AGAR|nr:unnamed protein product [Mycena citricolor]